MITIQSTPTSGHRGGRCGGGVPAEEQEGVEAGDLRQVRHHDHVGDDDRPAGDPAELRPHRLGHPGEAGAAVRVGFVHVVVAGGDQEHRDEGEQQDRRRLQGDGGGDEAEGRGEAVAGSGRGDADDDAGDEADRVLLQPLVAAARRRGRRRGSRRAEASEPLHSPSLLLSPRRCAEWQRLRDGTPTWRMGTSGKCPKFQAPYLYILYKASPIDLTQRTLECESQSELALSRTS